MTSALPAAGDGRTADVIVVGAGPRGSATAAWLAQARRLSPDLRRDSLRPPDLTAMLINASEAHICGCHTGGECECRDCQCPTCTCKPVA